MDLIWKKIVFVLIYSPLFISSIDPEDFYLDLIQRNLSDSHTFKKFYQDFLRDIRQHRIIDTVSSPINLEKLRSNDYDEDYLKNSCYQTASDLLKAHGYDQKNLNFSSDVLQTLLPAILNTVNNPGCERQLPQLNRSRFFNEWILGFIALVVMKLIHLLIIFMAGNHSSALTSGGISRTISTHTENNGNSIAEISFPPIKYHLWLGLGFNAFTCGILLGTVIYHLIPQIYQVPNEDIDYNYLLRGTMILCGIFLFFIVEKLLRFRFKVDEMQFDQSTNHQHQVTTSSDPSMIQMARMHGTFHVHEKEHNQHTHSEHPSRLPSNIDSGDEETALQADLDRLRRDKHSLEIERQSQRRNLILYHIIYDFSTDIIYGCGFATAMVHDRWIGLVLWLMIFSEGLRRHSQLLSSIGRKYGFAFLLVSIVFLLIGYLIGGALIQIIEQWNLKEIYLEKEYIYSIVYGALLYTALVTLIPELNDFGQHLQNMVKSTNQTSKQRRILKSLILICQNLFLLIGVLLTLILAILWRHNHRSEVIQYVCQRDPTRLFCPSAF